MHAVTCQESTASRGPSPRDSLRARAVCKPSEVVGSASGGLCRESLLGLSFKSEHLHKFTRLLVSDPDYFASGCLAPVMGKDMWLTVTVSERRPCVWVWCFPSALTWDFFWDSWAECLSSRGQKSLFTPHLYVFIQFYVTELRIP